MPMSDLAALLGEVGAAAVRAEAANSELRRAVRLAVAGGAEVAAVAREAGVSRGTVYRWADTDADTLDVGRVVDAALTILASHVPAYTAGQVSAGIGAPDLQVRLRRLQLGLAALASVDDLDEPERRTVTLATWVRSEAIRHRERTGNWPERLTAPS